MDLLENSKAICDEFCPKESDIDIDIDNLMFCFGTVPLYKREEFPLSDLSNESKEAMEKDTLKYNESYKCIMNNPLSMSDVKETIPKPKVSDPGNLVPAIFKHFATPEFTTELMNNVYQEFTLKDLNLGGTYKYENNETKESEQVVEFEHLIDDVHRGHLDTVIAMSSDESELSEEKEEEDPQSLKYQAEAAKRLSSLINFHSNRENVKQIPKIQKVHEEWFMDDKRISQCALKPNRAADREKRREQRKMIRAKRQGRALGKNSESFTEDDVLLENPNIAQPCYSISPALNDKINIKDSQKPDKNYKGKNSTYYYKQQRAQRNAKVEDTVKQDRKSSYGAQNTFQKLNSPVFSNTSMHSYEKKKDTKSPSNPSTDYSKLYNPNKQIQQQKSGEFCQEPKNEPHEQPDQTKPIETRSIWHKEKKTSEMKKGLLNDTAAPSRKSQIPTEQKINKPTLSKQEEIKFKTALSKFNKKKSSDEDDLESLEALADMKIKQVLNYK